MLAGFAASSHGGAAYLRVGTKDVPTLRSFKRHLPSEREARTVQPRGVVQNPGFQGMLN